LRGRYEALAAVAVAEHLIEIPYFQFEEEKAQDLVFLVPAMAAAKHY
jgi:hypothetical protein